MAKKRWAGGSASSDIPDVKVALARKQLEMLFCYLLRHPTLFLEARRELDEDYFSNDPTEAAMSLLWMIYNTLYDRYGQQPTKEILTAEYEAQLTSYRDERAPIVLESQQEEVLLLIETAYSMEQSVFLTNERYGKDLLYQFLIERKLLRPMNARLINLRHDTTLNDPGELINHLQTTYTRIKGLQSNPISPLIPEGWQLRIPPVIPTELPFIDGVIRGTENGKVYGIFGPSGAFKTGLAVQLCVARSAYEARMVDTHKDYKPGLCVYFTYEGNDDEIRIRAIATASRMPTRSVKDYYSGCEPLSVDRHSMKDYEKEREEKIPEAERLQSGAAMGRFVQISDMSGGQRNPGGGKGYVEEIAAILDRLQRDSNQHIAAVYVDYAKLLVRNYMTDKGLPPQDIRHYLSRLPMLFQRDVASAFSCPVWIVQQLNTISNQKAAGAAQHHAWSSESGDFGENLWNCICISSIDKLNDHTTQITFSKTRDSAGIGGGIVLRLDGNINALVKTESHMVDPGTRRIVRTAIAGTVVTPVKKAQSRQVESANELDIPPVAE